MASSFLSVSLSCNALSCAAAKTLSLFCLELISLTKSEIQEQCFLSSKSLQVTVLPNVRHRVYVLRPFQPLPATQSQSRRYVVKFSVMAALHCSIAASVSCCHGTSNVTKNASGYNVPFRFPCWESAGCLLSSSAGLGWAYESENPLTMGWLSTDLDCSPTALLHISVLLLGPAD